MMVINTGSLALGSLTIGLIVLLAVLKLIISAGFLKLTTVLFKTKDHSFKTALLTSLWVLLVELVIQFPTIFLNEANKIFEIIFLFISWIIIIVFGIVLIRHVYRQDLGRTLLLWLIWRVLTNIVTMLLFLILVILGTATILL